MGKKKEQKQSYGMYVIEHGYCKDLKKLAKKVKW